MSSFQRVVRYGNWANRQTIEPGDLATLHSMSSGDIKVKVVQVDPTPRAAMPRVVVEVTATRNRYYKRGEQFATNATNLSHRPTFDDAPRSA